MPPSFLLGAAVGIATRVNIASDALRTQARNMNAGFSVSSFCPPPFVEIRVRNLGSSMGRHAT